MSAFSGIMTLEQALPPEKLLYLHFGAKHNPEYARLIGLTIAQHPPGRPAPPCAAHGMPLTRHMPPPRQNRGGTS